MIQFSDTMAVAGLTDVGLRRRHNEDSFSIDEDLGLFMVADGLGGHEAGEVASRTALEEIVAVVRRHARDTGGGRESPDHEVDERADGGCDPEPLIRDAVGVACRAIHDMNRERNRPDGRGMGTTLAGLWFSDDLQRAALFHVGDSRIYRLRADRLERLTRDHTAYEDWLARDREGPEPKKNVIVRAVGPRPETVADVSLEPVRADDRYLLCTDGLHGMADDGVIEAVLRRDGDPEATCRRLVELAKERGGRDNVTVVVACVKRPRPSGRRAGSKRSSSMR